MTAIFIGLALLLITLVTVLVLVLEKQSPPPRRAPPPPPPLPKRRRPKASRTNPFGVAQPGAMILSRRVLSNLPLPPPPDGTELDVEGPFGDEVKTLVRPPRRPRDEQIIVIEVDD